MPCSGYDWQPRSRVLRSGARYVVPFYTHSPLPCTFPPPPCIVSLHPVSFHSTLYRFTPPCIVSLHPVPFHSTLCRFTPPCAVSLHSVPFHSTLFRFTPPCIISLHPIDIPFYSTLCRFMPPCTVLLHPVPFHSTLYHFTPPCTFSLLPVPFHSTLHRFTSPCTVSLQPVPFHLCSPSCAYSCPSVSVPYLFTFILQLIHLRPVRYLLSSIQYKPIHLPPVFRVRDILRQIQRPGSVTGLRIRIWSSIWIRLRIRILLFLSVVFKMPTKN
jgi:hypothetical protein